MYTYYNHSQLERMMDTIIAGYSCGKPFSEVLQQDKLIASYWENFHDCQKQKEREDELRKKRNEKARLARIEKEKSRQAVIATLTPDEQEALGLVKKVKKSNV